LSFGAGAGAQTHAAGSSSYYIPPPIQQLDDEVAVINSHSQSDVVNLDLNPGTGSPSPASMMFGLSVAPSGSKRPAPPALSTALKRRKMEDQLRVDVLSEQLTYFQAKNAQTHRETDYLNES
jgi:hypothetical protein